MLQTLSILRGNPALRAAAAAIFLFGFAGAATAPYKSVIAIRELGLSDSGFSLLILASAVANVILSMGIGILADGARGGAGRYRAPLIACAALGVLGYGMVWLIGTRWALILAMLGPIAGFMALNALIFASARVHSQGLGRADSAGVSSLMRGMISLAWILVPGVVGIAMARSDSMLGVFGIAAGLALATFAVLVFLMPADPDTPAEQRAPRLSLRGTLALLANGPLALRVLLVAMITALLHVNAAVMPLITTGRAGGSTADIGFAVGFVALLEVVFILVWDRVARIITPIATLGLGVAIYTVYLVWMANASAPWHVYGASLFAGIGAAAIISLPLGYLQDLIADRPGLSASLITVNVFLGGAIGSALFAIGSALGGYGMASILGAGVGALGAIGLMTLEGWRVRAPA